MTYHNHSVEGRRRQRLTSRRFTLRDLGPSPVVADDRRRVGGELVVGVAVDGDVLPVFDGTPYSQVNGLAHFNLWHNALSVTLWKRVRPGSVSLFKVETRLAQTLA